MPRAYFQEFTCSCAPCIQKSILTECARLNLLMFSQDMYFLKRYAEISGTVNLKEIKFEILLLTGYPVSSRDQLLSCRAEGKFKFLEAFHRPKIRERIHLLNYQIICIS
uniref:Uncharacterized protein n=1 Tax=Schistocephalus solidus TaxID=70667 RepID=A0A0V0J4E5_SCHSO